jgi:hypothetical protein
MHTLNDIENVETVFKDGVGYDTAALLASVRGRYGEYRAPQRRIDPHHRW